ncbi:50S ribosomal protein L4 [Fluviibacter phosphoraccumulans]|jgi:large subunit ribosomal protein L4|uniref:Large ribosomal subunit protein uL4 n=1 Tax=Fluviibacter phosphoraccumulans TaxID=1751046 RepID=A0A679HZJ9_9RHOO|nr:50S ribosomal protein L4 [Fluviibacter phosphoraccumulans]BBU68120.1 50S ribosomal protein L4 [Fluviibacter phosphoraccumulans]BBU70340.1 50S ribosomal protein L4 [Fluviibacter phosphoraccumulans]BCA66297.1 50S ribosomal protein L4 [Fluviibacter phosphoraccumulans]
MELKVINDQGQEASRLQASDVLFAREYNEDLVHQLVVGYQANARSANSKQKGRDDVAHTTHKPWRQKGTGNARSGMTSSPIWRGGGRAFPNSPEQNYAQKINRKMYRAGMATILSQLVREDRLAVVDAFAVEAPKTKLFAQKVKNMGFDRVLVITDNLDENLWLSSRNLPNVLVLEAKETDPVSLVRYAKVVVTRNAVAKFEEMWG